MDVRSKLVVHKTCVRVHFLVFRHLLGLQATKALPIADALISVQARAEAEIADLADSISAAVRDEQAARNKRQKVASEAAGDAGQSV